MTLVDGSSLDKSYHSNVVAGGSVAAMSSSTVGVQGGVRSSSSSLYPLSSNSIHTSTSNAIPKSSYHTRSTLLSGTRGYYSTRNLTTTTSSTFPQHEIQKQLLTKAASSRLNTIEYTNPPVINTATTSATNLNTITTTASNTKNISLDIDQRSRRASLDNSCLSSNKDLMEFMLSRSIRSTNPQGGSGTCDYYDDFDDDGTDTKHDEDESEVSNPIFHGLDGSSSHYRHLDDLKGAKMFNAGRVYDDKLLLSRNHPSYQYGLEEFQFRQNQGQQPQQQQPKDDLDMDCHAIKRGPATSTKTNTTKGNPTTIAAYHSPMGKRKLPSRSRSSPLARMNSSSSFSSNSSISSPTKVSGGGSAAGGSWVKAPYPNGTTTTGNSSIGSVGSAKPPTSPVKNHPKPKITRSTAVPAAPTKRVVISAREYALGLGSDSEFGEDDNSSDDSFCVANEHEQANDNYILQDLGASLYFDDEEFFNHHIKPHVVPADDDDAASLDEAIEEQVLVETVLPPASESMKSLVMSMTTNTSSSLSASSLLSGGTASPLRTMKSTLNTGTTGYIVGAGVVSSGYGYKKPIKDPSSSSSASSSSFGDDDSDCDSFCDATGTDKANFRYLGDETSIGGGCGSSGDDWSAGGSSSYCSRMSLIRRNSTCMSIGEEGESDEDDSSQSQSSTNDADDMTNDQLLSGTYATAVGRSLTNTLTSTKSTSQVVVGECCLNDNLSSVIASLAAILTTSTLPLQPIAEDIQLEFKDPANLATKTVPKSGTATVSPSRKTDMAVVTIPTSNAIKLSSNHSTGEMSDTTPKRGASRLSVKDLQITMDLPSATTISMESLYSNSNVVTEQRRKSGFQDELKIAFEEAPKVSSPAVLQRSSSTMTFSPAKSKRLSQPISSKSSSNLFAQQSASHRPFFPEFNTFGLIPEEKPAMTSTKSKRTLMNRISSMRSKAPVEYSSSRSKRSLFGRMSSIRTTTSSVETRTFHRSSSTRTTTGPIRVPPIMDTVAENDSGISRGLPKYHQSSRDFISTTNDQSKRILARSVQSERSLEGTFGFPTAPTSGNLSSTKSKRGLLSRIASRRTPIATKSSQSNNSDNNSFSTTNNNTHGTGIGEAAHISTKSKRNLLNKIASRRMSAKASAPSTVEVPADSMALHLSVEMNTNESSEDRLPTLSSPAKSSRRLLSKMTSRRNAVVPDLTSADNGNTGSMPPRPPTTSSSSSRRLLNRMASRRRPTSANQSELNPSKRGLFSRIASRRATGSTINSSVHTPPLTSSSDRTPISFQNQQSGGTSGSISAPSTPSTNVSFYQLPDGAGNAIPSSRVEI